MKSLAKLNQALTYIEANLRNDIDMQHVAHLAHCSEYHFRRMFSLLAGMPVSDYIRRRRLTLAAFELLNTNAQIIQIALEFRYASPDAFTRAFAGFHGVTPSEARRHKEQLKAFAPVRFQLRIQGGQEMTYRIVEKPAFHIVGFKKEVKLVYEGVNPEIAQMWQALTPEIITELKALSNVEPYGLISASTNFSEGREEGGTLDQYIGVATTHNAGANFAQLMVPALTWAVFEAVGEFPSALQDVWARIYSEWFPSANFEATEGPELLWNAHKDTSQPDYKSEIWIPVVPKAA